MKLFTIEDKEQKKLLRSKLKPFDFSTRSQKEVRQLVNSMRKKMNEWQGVGLAANQAGFDEQFFVAENGEKFYAIFNPQITKTFGEPLELEEGCLSVPKKYGQTKRYEKIILEGQNSAGKKIKIKAHGLLAQIFQHEVGHLNGELFIDHATELYDIK